MELSTKKIFYSKINSTKKKLTSSKKTPKTSVFSNTKLKKSKKKLNRYTTKEKEKEKGKNKLNNNDIPLFKVKNPFSNNQIKFKSKIKFVNISSKMGFIKLNTNEKKHVLNSKKEEISDFTNIISTAGSETYHQKQDDFNLDKLCDEFKNSKLKSNFIIDKNGNNILNLEPKRNLKKFSYSKKDNLLNIINKCKIGEIKPKKFNFLDKRSKAIYSEICHYRYSVDIGRKVKSSKQNNKFKNLFEENNIDKNYCEELRDNNSLFETISDKSMDLSFINSEDDEKLVLAIQNSCSKN